MKVAKLNSDGSVYSVSRPHWVWINEGKDNESRQPPTIFKLWSDKDLNDIGYARFEDTPVPQDKRISGTTDTLLNGRVKRTYTLVDYVPPPPPPDPVPGDENYNYEALRQRDYPTVGDQLDALWKELNVRRMAGDDLVQDADDILDQVLAVKATHPKPV